VGNKNTTENKRHFSRILFDASCTLHQNDKEWKTELLDISLHGILVKSPSPLDADFDKPFEAVISLSEAGDSIIMSVKLTHREPNHLGFECEYIDIDSITHLKRLVELNLGDHDLLNRELGALTIYHHESES
jgi:hypothetical protein